jgi:adenylate cyclase
VHASPAVLYSCKVAEDCGTIAVTANVRRLLGYEPEEFTNDPSFWAVRIHPEDSTRVFEELSELFRRGAQVSEYRWRRQDGTYAWLRDHMRLEFDGDGQPARILGCWIEIENSRRAAFSTQVLTRDPQTTSTMTEGERYANKT